jgi:hypothetical protein
MPNVQVVVERIVELEGSDARDVATRSSMTITSAATEDQFGAAVGRTHPAAF